MTTTHSTIFDSRSSLSPSSGVEPWTIARCLIWVCAIRVAILLIGIISAMTYTKPFDPMWSSGIPWIAFDGTHYFDLARNGYPPPEAALDPTGQAFSQIAYFPLYPMLCRALGHFMPLTTSLLLVTNICSLIGLGFFFAWVDELTDDPRLASIATILVSVSPGAVFFCASMTEGIFFMLTAISFWFLGRGKYWHAAIASTVASTSRPTALGLAVAISLTAILQDENIQDFFRLGTKEIAKRITLAGALGFVAMAGTLLYFGLLTMRYHESGIALYGAAQHTWEVDTDRAHAAENEAHDKALQALHQGVPLEVPPERYSLRWFYDRLDQPQSWNRAIGLGILFITLAGLYKPMGIPRPLFMLPLSIWCLGYLPNHGMRASSLYRYEMPGLPIFLISAIWLAKPNRRMLLGMVMTLCLALQVYYAFRFSRGLWVG